VRKLALAFACFLSISTFSGFAQTSEQTRSEDGQNAMGMGVISTMTAYPHGASQSTLNSPLSHPALNLSL
jgi:hypothetical protein